MRNNKIKELEYNFEKERFDNFFQSDSKLYDEFLDYKFDQMKIQML